MIDGYPRILIIIAAAGTGVSAGVYFAFSTFVMKALGRLPATQGISAMQAINKAAPAPLFMLALFGTGALSIALSALAVPHLDQRWAVCVLAATALYLVSVILTMVYHVPRNDALALVDPNGPGAARAWAHYLSSWTAWNHVRTVTALAGSTVFIIALRAI
ncbi:MAG TPA: anthrone oxygenase family protein [Trebonia sp.]|jgi:uncharacterized membrane protein